MPYRGRPLLSYIVSKLPEETEKYVTVNRKFDPREVKLVIEDVWHESQSLGALGSLDNAIRTNSVDEDALVIAGDNYFEF